MHMSNKAVSEKELCSWRRPNSNALHWFWLWKYAASGPIEQRICFYILCIFCIAMFTALFVSTLNSFMSLRQAEGSWRGHMKDKCSELQVILQVWDSSLSKWSSLQNPVGTDKQNHFLYSIFGEYTRGLEMVTRCVHNMCTVRGWLDL